VNKIHQADKQRHLPAGIEAHCQLILLLLRLDETIKFPLSLAGNERCQNMTMSSICFLSLYPTVIFF
jgi:hypothetical protein